MTDFDDIAIQAWQSWTMQNGGLTLVDKAGLVIPCGICGQSDKWHLEGEQPYATPVWVCEDGPEHTPIMTGRGGFRVIDSVRYHEGRIKDD